MPDCGDRREVLGSSCLAQSSGEAVSEKLGFRPGFRLQLSSPAVEYNTEQIR
jgi:hypothetical protein